MRRSKGDLRQGSVFLGYSISFRLLPRASNKKRSSPHPVPPQILEACLPAALLPLSSLLPANPSLVEQPGKGRWSGNSARGALLAFPRHIWPALSTDSSRGLCLTGNVQFSASHLQKWTRAAWQGPVEPQTKALGLP